MSTWDEIVELLAHLDWIERVDEMVRMLFGPPSWRFSFPRNCGKSGYQVERMLKQRGIKVWGRNFNRTHFFFRVRRDQANWAEYLMWRSGVPVTSRTFNERNREAAHRQ